MESSGPSLGKVLFDFLDPSEDEISLREGEVITVLERDDGGWWRGEKLSGEAGLFPFNYIEIIEPHADEQTVVSGERGKQPVVSQQSEPYRDHSKPTSSAKDVDNLVHAHVELPIEPKDSRDEVDSPSRQSTGFMALNFRNPEIESIAIVSTELGTSVDGSGKKFTLYNVCVRTARSDERVAPKRYSEFRALAEALRKTFPVIGGRLHKLMQSKMKDRMEYFRRFADDVVQKRKEALDTFLQALAKNRSVSALLIAWLFQGEKAEVDAVVPMRSSIAAKRTIKDAIVIQDWLATDATEITLKRGERIKIYSYLANGWIEGELDGGLRGMCPLSYLRELDVSEHGKSQFPGFDSNPNTQIQDHMPSSPQPKRQSLGIENFQLTSLEAFDQLIDQGFAIEIKEESSDPSDVPSVSDKVEIELRGMIWDASQTVVTEFVRDKDIASPCIFTVGKAEMTKGLDLALQKLPVGTHAMVVVSPPLAYAEIGEPRYGIPASVHVVFDIRIVSIVKALEKNPIVGDARGDDSSKDIGNGGMKTRSKGGMSLQRKNSSLGTLAKQKGRSGRMTLAMADAQNGDSLVSNGAVTDDLSSMSNSQLIDRAAKMVGIEIDSNTFVAADDIAANHQSGSKPVEKDIYSSEDNVSSIDEQERRIVLTFDEIKKMCSGSMKFPLDVDRSRLEDYLSTKEFSSIFGMARASFRKLPIWKQKNLKRQNDIF